MNSYIEFETMTSNSDRNYLIDNILELYPEEKLLLNRLTQQHIQLHRTATQCLVLLLEKHNEVVTQDELLRFAWGEKHREVTHNAFYQCILNLRKSILRLGVEKTIVTTIARKGLIINNDVTIDKITTSRYHDLVVQGMNSNTTNVDNVLAVKIQEEQPHNERFNFHQHYKTCGMLLLTSFILIFIWATRPDIRSIYDIPNYTALDAPEEQKCIYYLNSDYINNYSEQESKVGHFIKNNPAFCSAGKHIYITAYENLKSMSVLVCNHKIGNISRNMCHSIYYLDNI